MKKHSKGILAVVLAAAMLFGLLLTQGAVPLAETAGGQDMTVSKSKTASPTELTDENLRTTVTLSLPAEEIVNAADIVFVVEKSTSTALVGTRFDAAGQGLLDALLAKDVKVKVGVIKFRGIATDMIKLKSGDALKELVEYGDANK